MYKCLETTLQGSAFMTFPRVTTPELFKFGAQLKKELAAQSTSNVVSIFKNFYSSIVVAVDGNGKWQWKKH